jgi:carboxypeptidase T
MSNVGRRTSVSCRSFVLVLALLWLLDCPSWTNAAVNNANETLRGTTTDVFPSVYTTLIPRERRPFPSSSTAKGADDDDVEGVVFAAQVDMLRLDCEDETTAGSTTSTCRIWFLVHSASELGFLTTILQKEQAQLELLEVDIKFQTARLEYDDLETQQIRRLPTPQQQARKLQPYSTIPGWDCIKSLAGSYEFAQAMVERAASIPNLSVTWEDIGDSYSKTQNAQQGHDLFVLKLTGNGVVNSAATTGRSTVKGTFLAMSGLHPREYPPPELLSRWAQLLVDGYGVDPHITGLLDHVEIHLLLQTNPDGRVLAETTQFQNRRKNVNPTGNNVDCPGGDVQVGVDLNRNFPFYWGDNTGSSNNPCAQTYRGSGPASEPEVSAIVEYALRVFPTDQRKTSDALLTQNEPYDPTTTQGIFIDIHSYGNFIIYPWGFENKESPNHAGLSALVSKMTFWNNYDSRGPGTSFYGAASGASEDWAYATLGAASMTMEIGSSFRPTCDEIELDILPANLDALTFAANLSSAP